MDSTTASDRHSTRAVFAVAVVCVVVLMAARIGEPDRAEAGAIALVRAVMSAEFTYSSVSKGLYSTPECLASASCVPGGLGPFLAPDLKTMNERRGYRFEFHAGAKDDSMSDRRMSQSAITRFAVTGIPTSQQQERHSFCGDDRGSIYFTSGEVVPQVEAGRCVETHHSVADLRQRGR